MRQLDAMKATLDLLRSRGMEERHGLVIEKDHPAGLTFPHLVSMYERARDANPPFSEAKLGRWLGWMQGSASALCFMTLEDAKIINQEHSDDR